MQLNLQIPDDLAAELGPRKERLPRILSLGLRELDAEGAAGFSGLADVVEFLANLPKPEKIMALRPSQALQAQSDALLERSREGDLSDEEDRQWRNFTSSIWFVSPRFDLQIESGRRKPNIYSSSLAPTDPRASRRPLRVLRNPGMMDFKPLERLHEWVRLHV